MTGFLLDTEGFPARWNCGSAWSQEPWLGWTHIVADIATATAYVAIPILLLIALRRARHLPAPRLLVLFAIFILACGSVHLIEAIIFWHPIYRLSAVVKVVTAVSSCLTAITLAYYLPHLLLFRSPEELQQEVDRQTLRLEEVKERLSMALAAGSMGAWEWNLDTGEVRLDATEAALVGMTGHPGVEEGETIVQITDFYKLVDEHDRDELQRVLKLTIEYGATYDHVFRITTPDGERKWIAGRGRLVQEPGRHRRLVGVNYDVTVQKLIEQDLAKARLEAEAASNAKSQFLANTSHEIRTPLTAILGCAESLVREAPDASTSATASLIHRQGQLLLHLLNDVLDLSKIEAGRLTVRKQGVCDVITLAEDIRSLMQPLALAKGLAFSLDLQDPLPRHLQTDPARVRQIVSNLVSNAIKFTKEGSVRFSVSSETTDGQREMLFCVEDTGIGIADDEQDAVFDAFHQAHEGTLPGAASHSVNSGAGLGLAIASRLASLLGGRLTLESEVGKGSTFCLHLPYIEPPMQRLRNMADRRAKQSSVAVKIERKGAILVAEDTASIQFLLRKILTPHATRIDFVDDGKSALQQLSAAHEAGDPYDVLLLDMNMPVMSGYEAAQRLRAAGEDIPIIALTASAMLGDRERCLEAGCNAYIPKPIDWNLLETEVQAALVRSSA
ncbi:hybrid sensor histidine kinase/response regulator [Botrimarina mediterranea]|uniref:histidine kinase n=1 Tax=Botrimarina mediterranea TaxID=2528022 RepID=A0A518KCV9_9BACT|nr:ATP-binding protein [Botrimarina mediterranea]QDV75618.1 Aerobic respiration control sensor protein ArcB [Botrimarina mediterranea]